MKVHHFGSVGLVALSYTVVLLLVMLTASTAQTGCIPSFLADGDCDDVNNNAKCGFDDGDCCEESCVRQNYVCGGNSGYDCVDPDYSEMSYSYWFGCDEEGIGNAYCDPQNNNDECGYDGGDCCSCTCPNVAGRECGGTSGWTCKDPSAPCMDFFVEAGTLTNVAVKANGFDTRPGEVRGGSGCMRRGCRARLTRDGDHKTGESRWSCRQSLVPHGEQCEITFSFESAMDIEYVQVAFYKPDKQFRTLQVTSNGVDVGTLESSSESASGYTTFVLHADDVETLKLTTSGLSTYKWISLLEVRFMVNSKNYWYGGGYDYGSDV